MRKLVGLTMLLMLVVALAVAGPAHAHEATPPAMTGHAGMHGTPMTGMAKATGAAFMTIENKGSDADRLVSAKTTIAGTVEIHEIKEVDGVMRMSPLENGLEIAAGSRVELRPGGYHIMYIGLTEDLTMGMTYTLTLHFEKAGDVDVTVQVRASAKPGTDSPPDVIAGDLTISGAWSRIAPAMKGLATPEASPMVTPGM